MTRIVGFCSPFMAASVVTRYLSCLPMAIDTYIRIVCTQIIIDKEGYSLLGCYRGLRFRYALQARLCRTKGGAGIV